MYYFEGLDIVDFSKRTATPFFVISENIITKNCSILLRLTKSKPNTKIYYSLKTNYESRVLQTIRKMGLGAEVSGDLDMFLAEKAQFPHFDIIVDGTNKSDAFLKKCVEKNIQLINIDSIDELNRLNKIAKGQLLKVNIGLRIDPQVSSYDLRNIFLTTGQRSYGLGSQEVRYLLNNFDKYSFVDIKGLLAHLTFSFVKPAYYQKSLKNLFSLAKQFKVRGVDIREINLGGGFPSQGIQHAFPFFSKFPVSLEHFIKAIERGYDANFRKTRLNLNISLEPGRSIMGNSAILVGKIVEKKGRNVYTDILMNDLGYRPLFKNRGFLIANKVKQSPMEKVNIYSASVNSFDKLFLNVWSPSIERGDILVIFGVGAYSIPYANQFSRPRSAVYFLNSSKKVELIRKKETLFDVTRNQVW